jgi:hypothetical protein
MNGAEPQEPKSLRAWKVKTLERLKREFIEKALREHGGNVTHAAKALGVHRSTLQRLMRRYDVPPRGPIEDESPGGGRINARVRRLLRALLAVLVLAAAS